MGGSYYFGSYEQNNKKKSKEAIEWIVLEVKEDRALLLCKSGIDYRAFNKEKGDTGWDSCSLREWLNGDFLESAFSEKEQEAIKKTKVSNNPSHGNEQWESQRLPVTKDKIFLLSYKEILQFLDSKQTRKMKDTAYASDKGNVVRKVTNAAIKEVGWWTRSPGKTKSETCIIGPDGMGKGYLTP